jgi:hypothetical protein
VPLLGSAAEIMNSTMYRLTAGTDPR